MSVLATVSASWTLFFRTGRSVIAIVSISVHCVSTVAQVTMKCRAVVTVSVRVMAHVLAIRVLLDQLVHPVRLIR